MTSENPTNNKAAEAQGLPPPCAGGCGFYGNKETKNCCSLCFKKMYPNEAANDDKKPKKDDNKPKDTEQKDKEPSKSEEPKKPIQKKKNRCWNCNKKVSLAGQFKCKCGYVYCAMHRYPDAHNCTFDWKKQHQDKLAKDNKTVAPSKLEKI